MTEPLPLDSPRWQQLRHAYTSTIWPDAQNAYNIPALLAQTAAIPAELAWKMNAEPTYSL